MAMRAFPRMMPHPPQIIGTQTPATLRVTAFQMIKAKPAQPATLAPAPGKGAMLLVNPAHLGLDNPQPAELILNRHG